MSKIVIPIRIKLASLVCIVLVLALLFPLATAGAGTPEQTTIVRCEPTTAYGVVGESDAVVDMYIQDVADLYGVDLRVSFFDTTIAQVVDQLPAPGVQIQPLSSFLSPDFVVRNVVDNTAGTIRYANTQINPAPPANGSGAVARITFEGLQTGTFTMTWGLLELSNRDGELMPATGQPCTIIFQSPAAVTLAGFEAQQVGDHVRVTWETVSELDNAGFNLYRGTSADGPDVQLNDALIPSQSPGSPEGFTYTYEDRRDLVSGTTYWYWLEDLDMSGVLTRHDPVAIEYQGAPSAVALSGYRASAAATLPALAGLGLVALTGLALRRRNA